MTVSNEVRAQISDHIAQLQTYFPDRVLSLVLRGIFLCRRVEIDWFLYGMRTLAPEPWRA